MLWFGFKVKYIRNTWKRCQTWKVSLTALPPLGVRPLSQVGNVLLLHRPLSASLPEQQVQFPSQKASQGCNPRAMLVFQYFSLHAETKQSLLGLTLNTTL